MTDWLILCTALFVAVFNRGGLIVALWLSVNALLWAWYVSELRWSALEDWSIYFWLKDFALIFLAGFLRVPLIITLSIAASCLFHQVISWQVLTYNWDNITLFDYRSDFMLYLSAVMLATAITETIGGGRNGGKRFVNYRFSNNGRLYRFFYLQTHKA